MREIKICESSNLTVKANESGFYAFLTEKKVFDYENGTEQTIGHGMQIPVEPVKPDTKYYLSYKKDSNKLNFKASYYVGCTNHLMQTHYLKLSSTSGKWELWKV